MSQPIQLNTVEKEAIYRMRELFALQKEVSIATEVSEEQEFITTLAEQALYPEKPQLCFQKVEENLEEQAAFQQDDTERFHLAKKLHNRPCICRLITCGGVDDGKSTLIGRLLYDTMDKQEQESIAKNQVYLRKDGSIDYALLAGMTEEEAKQGITVQVSYSTFEGKSCSFLMADVPGHEEYTRNMAYAALDSDTAIIMIAANKGIVPQTRRHTKICYFMGIRNMIFAVNKMDMTGYDRNVFDMILKEIRQMMQEYPGCHIQIVPVAAKSGVNIIQAASEMPWYQNGSLLELLEQMPQSKKDDRFYFLTQRICKSSQIKGAVIKKRVIQGEMVSGTLQTGDEIFVYPTNQCAKVTKLYLLDKDVEIVNGKNPLGIELDRELDIARGSVLTKTDILSSTDCIEADILWTSDNRLTQGKRYLAKIGTDIVNAAVTKIHYQVDVNTGDHRYAEYLTKNALARCELCFSKQVYLTAEKENRTLGTLKLFERETGLLAAYGNIIQTISGEVWKENCKEVTAAEREMALGQKAGLILFLHDEENYANCVERYLLGMGFHTMQLMAEGTDEKERIYIRKFLDAGMILLLRTTPEGIGMAENLIGEQDRIFSFAGSCMEKEEFSNSLKQIKQWASSLL